MFTSASASMLDRLEVLSRQEVSVDNATAMYLLMLKLLSHSGVISCQRKLFYPAIGADLFPLFYVNESWVSDKRLSLPQIHDAFCRLSNMELCGRHRKLLPRNRDLARRLHHHQEDFAAHCHTPSWMRTIRAGDVVLLKHAREYILGQMDRMTPSNWLEAIVSKIPPGVMVVIFEPKAVNDRAFPQSLSQFFLESGHFDDQMPVIFRGKSQSRIRAINDRIRSFDRQMIRTRIRCSGCRLSICCHCRNGKSAPEVYFEGVGALSVFAKN